MKLNEYQKNLVCDEVCDGRWSVVVGIYLGVSATPRKTANVAAGIEIESVSVTHSMQCGSEVLKFEGPYGAATDGETVKPAAEVGAAVFGRITKKQTFGQRVSYGGAIHPLPKSAAGEQIPLPGGAKK